MCQPEELPSGSKQSSECSDHSEINREISVEPSLAAESSDPVCFFPGCSPRPAVFQLNELTPCDTYEDKLEAAGRLAVVFVQNGEWLRHNPRMQ